MPQRAKIMKLPQEVRRSLEALIIKRGFGDYRGLVDWLRKEHGVDLSASTLSRHGQQLERKLEAIRIATEQAKAIKETTPDDEGALNDALIRLIQEKLFSLLVELDSDVARGDLSKIGRCVADLARATATQKKIEDRYRSRIKETADSIEQEARSAGATAERAAKFRQMVMGIDVGS